METPHLTRIELNFDGPVARVALAHPPVNVIDFAMMDELMSALSAIEQRSEVSTIVLSGTGRGLSAGVDIAIHTADKIQEMLTKFHGLILALAKCRKITIAEVRGVCLGGGAELAMVCDMVYTAKDTKWGFPEIALGCYPPVACAGLAALVGQKRAADLIFTGRNFSGEQAAEWGLANGAFAEDELPEVVQITVDHLSRLSPAVLGVTKKAFYAWDSFHLDKGVARAEKIYLEELMQTADATEGIQSFMEKRTPVWKAR
jgi:cyclohexa-1,5-dienecarbonyl-CoA hydratase